MAAWGTGSFENDEALDFVHEVVNLGGPDVVREAVDFVAAADEMIFIEAPVATRSLVAAELIAAARGRPAPDLPPAAAEWLATTKPAFDGAAADTARQAINRIASASGLKEMWDGSEVAEQWQESLRGLGERLGA